MSLYFLFQASIVLERSSLQSDFLDSGKSYGRRGADCPRKFIQARATRDKIPGNLVDARYIHV